MRGRIRICLAALAAFAAFAGCLATQASAKAPIYEFYAEPQSPQAGAHPDLLVHSRVGNNFTQAPVECVDCNTVMDVVTNTPAGVIGAPRDIPRCSIPQFSIGKCSPDSQVGMVCVALRNPGEHCDVMPLYNMFPKGGQAALMAFPVPLNAPLWAPIYISFTARTESDYGLEAVVDNIPRRFGVFTLSPNKVVTIFWGVPASPVHDEIRVPLNGFPIFPGLPIGLPNYGCSFDPIPFLLKNESPDCAPNYPATPSNAPETPFLSNPTACLGPLTASQETFAYDGETDFVMSAFPETKGCDILTFDPSLSAKPTTTEADSPSGLDVHLTVPQTLSPTAPTPSAIKDVSLRLPPGFTINSSAADGKVSCTAEEANFGTRLEAECPENAKIGTLAVQSSSFPETLNGAVYLGEPLPGDRYRLFLVFDGFSLHVKLSGTVNPDPRNGMVATFRDQPQFTFQAFRLHLFGAERGALATPTKCGTYPVKAEFTPWASELPKQTSTQFFAIDSGPDGAPCPGDGRPFNPDFEAGTTKSSIGGAFSPYAIRLSRADGDQYLSGVNVSPPLGFSAVLKGIPYCPQAAMDAAGLSSASGIAEQVAPACPLASQIGTVTGGAGAGSHVVPVTGRVFLAGPYKGAPMSLFVSIPAVSGPYDLGNFTTRVAVYVDPVSARVTTISDPLPQEIDGIPLRTRSVRVDIDRENFVINPTNCDPLASDAEIFGAEGGSVRRSAVFQVANCAKLPYGPQLSITLSGGVQRRGHPSIHAVVRTRPGEANSRSIQVTLPNGELLDNAHIGTVCTRPQFRNDQCPADSLVGSTKVFSPILDEPLTGNAYLRSSNNDLPDLALDLEGQFDVEAAGRVDTVNGRLRTTFAEIPDVPVSRIVLDLLGGKKGLLQNSESLCGRPKRATTRMIGQNGAVFRTKKKLQVACGSKSGRKGR